MNTQIVFGWAVIFAAFGLGSWQAIRWGKAESLSDAIRTAANILAAAVCWYICVWGVWALIAMTVIMADPFFISDEHIDWVFRGLITPWQWLWSFV